jgi:glycolate oxidase iron-sulfur subunit
LASQLTTALAIEDQKLLACVHCGLCLEACPTYIATGDENDSPRGRIYLMRAVAEGRLAADSASFESHIDRCLGCRACEAVCPAGVEYGQLLEAGRSELLESKVGRGFSYGLLRLVLRHIWLQPARLKLMFRLSRMLRNSGLPRLLVRSKLARLFSRRIELGLALLDSSRPNSSLKTSNTNQDSHKSAAQHFDVVLFKACVTEGLFERVNAATKRVLEVNGCAVETATGGVCCGALHAHAGDLEGARMLARQNIEAFELTAGEPIITNAGGCGAMLVSYAHLLAADEQYAERASSFSARVRDVGQQVTVNGVYAGAAIGSEAITYDASCHLLHGQHGANDSLQMLHAIPGLNLVRLNESEVCCGGAGVYNLMETELSAKVLDQKLKQIKDSGARVLATGNAGCQMQISAGARLQGLKLRVCHPVELLDESYQAAGLYAENNHGQQ